MKHKGTRNLAILLALALLFALVPGLSGTAYAAMDQNKTFKAGDMIHSGFPMEWIRFGDENNTREQVDDCTIQSITYNETSGKWVVSIPTVPWEDPLSLSYPSQTGKVFVGLKWASTSGNPVTSGYYQLTAVYEDAPTIAVTGVSLNKTSSTLTVGATETLTANVEPTDATDKSVSWSSDNTAVATVANGVVTAVAAGTATITATANDGSGVTGTCAVTVNNPTVSVTGVSLNKTSATLTVGGTATLTANVAPDDATDKTVKWSIIQGDHDIALYSDEGCTTPLSLGVATDTLTVYVKALEGADGGTVQVESNADSSKSATCAVTVSNPTIAINPGVRNSTYDDDNGVYKVTYDGNPYSVIVNVTTPASGATVKYRDTSGTYTLDASPTITDAGSLTVYYRVTAEGYSEYRGWATVEISKAEQTAPAAPTAASVTINSITLNTIPNGEYKCGDGKWQTSPTFTELTMNTSYTFYQRLVGDANHNPSLASSAASISTLNHVHNWSYEAHGATITATCTAAGCTLTENPTLTIAAPALTTYGGTESAEATVTGSIDGVTTPGIVYKKGADTLSSAPTDAGDYTANITLDGATASVAYTVNKVNISPSVSISGWTYGQTANTPSVSGNTGSGTVTYSYAANGSTDFSAAVPTNAGDYTVKATVAETNNYNGGEATADFTISRASITPTVSLSGWTYGQTANTPAVSDNTGNGEVTYTYAAKGSTDFSAAVPTNAGDYTVKATIAETNNYNGGEATADFTINKAAITITADDKSSRYGDELAELTHTVGGAYKAGDELGVTLNTTATKTSDVGEYLITVEWNENANYTATLVNGKYTITKTGLTVTATGYTGAYDGAAHGITVDVGSSGATVYYAAEELTAENYNTAGSTTLTYTDAGEYTVYFYVVSGNYDPETISGSKTVSISKATGTATDAQKPTAKTELVADNTDQTLVTAPAALPEGYTKLQYSLDGETWTDTIPTGKDAGNYTVNYKYVGDSNHNDFQGEPFTVTIKTLTVSFEVSGGSAVAAQSVVKGEKVTRPADPSKSGNAFDGWYQDATLSEPYDFAQPLTADVTLYAKWTPNDYTLTTITGTTSDANHVWYKDSDVTVVLTVKLSTEPDNSFAHYVRTEIDGTPVAATAREGSTVVTLAPADLQRLSVGAHTVSIVFDNGRVDTRLTVRQPSKTPSTGDQSHTALYLAALTVSVLGLAALTGKSKKRRSAKH